MIPIKRFTICDARLGSELPNGKGWRALYTVCLLAEDDSAYLFDLHVNSPDELNLTLSKLQVAARKSTLLLQTTDTGVVLADGKALIGVQNTAYRILPTKKLEPDSVEIRDENSVFINLNGLTLVKEFRTDSHKDEFLKALSAGEIRTTSTGDGEVVL